MSGFDKLASRGRGPIDAARGQIEESDKELNKLCLHLNKYLRIKSRVWIYVF